MLCVGAEGRGGSELPDANAPKGSSPACIEIVFFYQPNRNFKHIALQDRNFVDSCQLSCSAVAN